MKSAVLPPQAARDRQAEVRYYRKEAGSKVAVRFVIASNAALDQLVVRLLGERQDIGTILTEPPLPENRVA